MSHEAPEAAQSGEQAMPAGCLPSTIAAIPRRYLVLGIALWYLGYFALAAGWTDDLGDALISAALLGTLNGVIFGGAAVVGLGLLRLARNGHR